MNIYVVLKFSIAAGRIFPCISEKLRVD